MTGETTPPDNLRVFLITQDEPFYLAPAIKHLQSILPEGVSLVGAYVLNASPFGAKKSFLQKSKDTVNIFGFRFFVFFAWQFIISKLFRQSVTDMLKDQVPFVRTGAIPINAEDSLEEIGSHDPDIIISIASNQIFRKPLLDLPSTACLNLHTSMLPKYRGLMPLFWAMSNGDNAVGVTVFEMDEGLDSGPIVRQSELPIAGYPMHGLIKQTKYLGMLLIARALDDYRKGTVTYTPNDATQATRVPFPTKKDAQRFRSIGRRYF